MRELTSHKVNECNEAIEIQAHAAGAGGAPVRYDVFGPRKKCGLAENVPSFGLNIRFQDGPIADGINGITNEALLAIVEDRLIGFQSGKFACEENAAALRDVQSAMRVLKSRTQQRLARGVEGTHKV